MSVSSLLNVSDRFLITPHLFESLAVHDGSRRAKVSEAQLKRGHSYEMPKIESPLEARALHFTIQICILFTQGHIFLTLT